MKEWLIIDLLVLLWVVTFTGIIIPQILRVAFRKNLFDVPGPRKIHHLDIPRLGGIAFYPAILLSLFILYGFGMHYGTAETQQVLVASVESISFVFGGAVLLYLTGIADDIIGVKYKAKFLVQLIASVFVIMGNVTLSNLHGFLGFHQLSPVSAVILTVVIIVFVINAVNLIDGIDGLASGLSVLACAFYAVVFAGADQYVFSALAIATMGTLFPFFLFNVFGSAVNHRKIFMGDTGTLTIGLLLGVMSVRVCQLPACAGGENPGAAAFAPLLIPCLDVVRVYFYRLYRHQNPFLPDQTHIHHKMLALGLTQRAAMFIILLCSALLTLANFFLSVCVDINILFFCDLLLWIVVNYFMTHRIRMREQRLSKKLFD